MWRQTRSLSAAATLAKDHNGLRIFRTLRCFHESTSGRHRTAAQIPVVLHHLAVFGGASILPVRVTAWLTAKQCVIRTVGRERHSRLDAAALRRLHWYADLIAVID